MYPRLRRTVTLRKEPPAPDGEERCTVCTGTGEYTVSRELFRILERADGTHPLNLSPEVVENLIRQQILTRSPMEYRGLRGMVILCTLGPGVLRFRPLCRRLNRLLPLCCGAVFLGGLCLPPRALTPWDGGSALLFAGLCLLGLLGHEAGHLIARTACGLETACAGILLWGPFPCGMFVMPSGEENPADRRRIQVFLAGAEADLLRAGLCLMSAAGLPDLSTPLYASALCSFLMAVFNLLPLRGTDGEQALSALLGVPSVARNAARFLKEGDDRRRTLRSGPRGYAEAVLYVLLLLLRVAVPVLTAALLLLLCRAWIIP